MKTNFSIFLVVLMLISGTTLRAQEDTIQRQVTVEREIKPVVRSSEKLMAKPQEFQPEIQAPEVVFSEYSSPLSTDFNLSTLGHADTRFATAQQQHGYLRAGAGYPLSLFDFSYRVDDETLNGTSKRKRRNEGYLDLYASHLGQWGKKALSESAIGVDYHQQFSSFALSFGANGEHEYFHRYYRGLPGKNTQNNWQANVFVNAQSTPGALFDWHGQVAYEGTYLMLTDPATEHAIHTSLGGAWSMEEHHVGLEVDIHNRFHSWREMMGDMVVSLRNNNHRLHFEPYYAYEGKRVHLHAGVNLDVSANRGRRFGASPNVLMEAFVTKNWLAIVAEAKGTYEAPSVRQELEHNRFLDEPLLMQEDCGGLYMPIDAKLAMRFRPHTSLLVDVFGTYAYQLDAHTCLFDVQNQSFLCAEQDRQIFSVGGALDYHFRDIFHLSALGHYYFAGDAYDLPLWDTHVRMEGRINTHWSLYADAFLQGSRRVALYDNQAEEGMQYQTATLHPSYDVNLGLEYTIRKGLSVFAQLNNIIAWTDKLTPMVLYNTPAQGANGLVGVTWSF